MKLAFLVNQMPDIIYRFQPGLIFQKTDLYKFDQEMFQYKRPKLWRKMRPLEKYCLGSPTGRIQIMVLTTFPFRFPSISSFFGQKLKLSNMHLVENTSEELKTLLPTLPFCNSEWYRIVNDLELQFTCLHSSIIWTYR